MSLSRKDLFNDLFEQLLEQGFIDENNYDTSIIKSEFINVCSVFFEKYYLLDQLHEIE